MKYVQQTNKQKLSAAPFALHCISQVIFSSPALYRSTAQSQAGHTCHGSTRIHPPFEFSKCACMWRCRAAACRCMRLSVHRQHMPPHLRCQRPDGFRRAGTRKRHDQNVLALLYFTWSPHGVDRGISGLRARCTTVPCGIQSNAIPTIVFFVLSDVIAKRVLTIAVRPSRLRNVLQLSSQMHYAYERYLRDSTSCKHSIT